VAGGESPYLQQQNFSLAALAKRDAKLDPFSASSAAPAPAEEDDVPEADAELEAAGAGAWLTRYWEAH